MTPRPASRGWLWAAVALTAVKLWLVAGQRIFAIGPSFHDDRLFVELAEQVINGQWLGPYNQFTLAKGPMMPVFIAAAFKLGLPLVFAQQLLYAGACATLTRSLRPWLRTGAAWFVFYGVLLWNPMSYEAENLSRVMRQNIYTPLALFCVAGLISFFSRRRESAARLALPAALGGLTFGCFWLTREESIWFVPAVGLLLIAPALALRHELRARWRPLAAGWGSFVITALLPLLFVCSMNLHHYGWFGTVEFRAPEFNAAYGALTRPIIGPDLKQVPVTRQMREEAYELSPAFAKLRPQLEGAVGEHWIERVWYPAADRQIRGGWMVWALRDAVHEAGFAPDAGTAMRYYQTVADELNAACDAGRVPARPRRSGFLPPLGRELVRPLLDDAVTYTNFFFLFRGFSAFTPDSIGDYADLKPFRNMVGTRLSNAPRSPELRTPEQNRRDRWKVEMLQQIGKTVAAALALLGPFLLIVGVVRGCESALTRRFSYAFGLAAALLLSCLAYLAINILVQVTSFYNMSPAALAPAYPLYLLALTAIVIDAAEAWRRRPASAKIAASLAPPASRRWRISAIISGTALGLVLALPHPLALDPSTRWQRWLGGEAAVKDLTFALAGPSPFGPERLQGAAPVVTPEGLRNYFYGTAPDGPGLTGIIVSSPFTLTKPWLIVPYVGYPVGNGNGLRIRILAHDGDQVLEEIGCPGPNNESVSYWTADVHAHQGRRACLVLYDGRTDTEAWVAASPPVPTDSPELALKLARGLQSESYFVLRVSVALVALIGLLRALLGWWRGRIT